MKSGQPIPSTSMNLYAAFLKDVEFEFNRLKEKGFEEEFVPARLFKYNMTGFDHILDSNSEGDNSSQFSYSDAVSGSSEEDDDEGEEEDDDSDDGSENDDEEIYEEPPEEILKKNNQRKGQNKVASLKPTKEVKAKVPKEKETGNDNKQPQIKSGNMLPIKNPKQKRESASRPNPIIQTADKKNKKKDAIHLSKLPNDSLSGYSLSMNNDKMDEDARSQPQQASEEKELDGHSISNSSDIHSEMLKKRKSPHGHNSKNKGNKASRDIFKKIKKS